MTEDETQPNARILVVEDDRSLRDMLARVLSAGGFEVALAATAQHDVVAVVGSAHAFVDVSHRAIA